MSTYCTYCASPEANPIHVAYHDFHYGFPITDNNQLFERLILEINQAGLSWETILKKQEAFKRAYYDFDIQKIARFGMEDTERLMNDAGIIRNKKKIEAAIYNAQRVLEICEEYGSFNQWLDHHHPKPLASWVKEFKKEFRFVGGEIVNEFLMSIGYLSGAHAKTCPIFDVVLQQQPKWLKT